MESQARQSSHTTLAAAMHPQQAPTADGAAGIQAQAVLRQQLHQQAQQQAQQQQARLQQRHLARQQLQQQIHLQAQQRMLQQRQQQQQHASPHQQAQPGVAKQEPTRKGSASSKRQSVGPEGKVSLLISLCPCLHYVFSAFFTSIVDFYDPQQSLAEPLTL